MCDVCKNTGFRPAKNAKGQTILTKCKCKTDKKSEKTKPKKEPAWVKKRSQ